MERRRAGKKQVLGISMGRPKKRTRRQGSGVPHVRRESFSSSCPIHVTVRVCKGVPRLQSRSGMRVIRAAFSVARDRLDQPTRRPAAATGRLASRSSHAISCTRSMVR